MLATGTDAKSGNQDDPAPYLRYADDAINMPCQASTQWDALSHIFLDDKMYNGYDAALVDVRGAKKLGIEHVRDKMVGRGVLLDVARFKGVSSLEDGYGFTVDDLNACAAAQKVEVRKGDFVIVRTGHQERCLAKKDWSGYAGGNAPGFAFETCYWLREKDVAAICSDMWGARFVPTRRTRPTNRGIGSSFRLSEFRWARSSISRSSPMIARKTGSTNFSSARRRFICRAGPARRSIRRQSNNSEISIMAEYLKRGRR
jgi:kynurenine formamidase